MSRGGDDAASSLPFMSRCPSNYDVRERMINFRSLPTREQTILYDNLVALLALTAHREDVIHGRLPTIIPEAQNNLVVRHKTEERSALMAGEVLLSLLLLHRLC